MVQHTCTSPEQVKLSAAGGYSHLVTLQCRQSTGIESQVTVQPSLPVFPPPLSLHPLFSTLFLDPLSPMLQLCRAQHGVTNHIPESFLPPFFDLVVWGHEHECHVEPEYHVCGEDADGEETGMYIYQPGSSVATSLCEGEVGRK